MVICICNRSLCIFIIFETKLDLQEVCFAVINLGEILYAFVKKKII